KTVFGGQASGVATVVSIPNNGIAIDWNLDKNTQEFSFVNINNLPVVGCTQSVGTQLAGFNDWANVHFDLRASLEFAGGADTEQTDTTAEQEADGFGLPDTDGNNVADGFQCSSVQAEWNTPAAACLLDVKPGDPFNISNLIAPLQGVVPAALLGSATFDPTT